MKHTFDDICRIEPQVRMLMESVPERMNVDDGFWRKWSGIKMRMTELVGFNSPHDELTSCGDYNTAYQELLAEANRCEDIIEAAEQAAELVS